MLLEFAPCRGEPIFIPLPKAMFDFGNVTDVGGTYESAQDQGWRGAGGSVVALNHACTDITERFVLNGSQLCQELAAQVGRFRWSIH